MLIWAAMIIPIIALLILGFKYNSKLVWWEYVAIIAIPALMIWGAKSICESAQVHCTEYWGSFLTHAEYHEDWDEWITQTCVRCGGYDDKGNCDDWETYDCSYRQYHPEYWEVWNKAGDGWQVDKDSFEQLCLLWGSRNFVDLHHHFYTKDGNEYETDLPVSYVYNQIIATTTEHSYENRVQASHSIFNYKEIKKKDAKLMGLYDHPPVNSFHQNCILGDAPEKPSSEIAIGYVNAMLGSPSKVRFYALIFKNKPIEISYDQEAYWKGGNKNELEICVGVDDAYKPTWVRVFGWSKQEEVKINIRDFIMRQEVLNINDLSVCLYAQAEGRIIRRDFREFKYLTVDPPTWVVILVYFLTLLLCGGIGWFEVDSDVAELDNN